MQMKKIFKKIIVIMIMFYLIVSCFIGQRTFAVSVPHLSITSIKYSVGNKIKDDSAEQKELKVGDTLQLYAIIAHGNDLIDPDNNTDSLGWVVDKVIEDGATWTSSNTSIATVDNTGKVTGKAEGTTTITVNCKGETLSDNTTNTYQINVKKSSEPASDFKYGDFSKATIKVETEGNFKNHYLTVSNATFRENNEYYILVSHSKENTSYITDTTKYDDLSEKGYKSITEKNPKIDITRIAEENGELYYTIVELGTNEEHVTKAKVIKTGTVERAPLNPIGNRIRCYFFSDYTSTFFYDFLNDTTKEKKRNIKIKIGTITDNNILTAIRDGKSNSLQNLMTYAKNASSPMYTGTVPLGSSASITGGMNLVNDAYYYVYMEMDDENGKYIPVEDVSLYQGCVGESVGKNLWDYLDSNFKWKLSEGGNNVINDPTVAKGKYPYTGSIIIGSVAIILSGVCIFLLKKNIGLKDVK